MHDRDTALLARTATALRAQGRTAAADQLDAAVADLRSASRSVAADLDGVRSGTFVLRAETDAEDEADAGTDAGVNADAGAAPGRWVGQK